MSAKYPSFNDRTFDLLKKITDNTAEIAAGGGGSLPDQTGHAGQYLTTDGSAASWATVSGSGTVTSVSSANANIGVSDPTIAPILTLASALAGINSVTSATGQALTLASLDTNKNVNIVPHGTGAVIIRNGTALPTIPSGFTCQLGPYGISEGIADAGYLAFRRTNGTAASPTAILANQSIGYLPFSGYKASAYSGDAAYIAVKAEENWTDSATGTRFDFATTQNGGTSAASRMQLHDSGKLELGLTNGSLPAWGTTGALLRISGLTWTDTNSSGTVATATNASFLTPTFAASSATTFTNAANLYIAGDVAAGTNVTLTNGYGLWNVGKTRLDGRVEVGAVTLDATTDFNLSRDITGSMVRVGYAAQGLIQSDVTTRAVGYYGGIGTAAAAFTIGEIRQFGAYYPAKGAGSTVTKAVGFWSSNADSGAATTRYAFEGQMVADGTSAYNLYMSGTAPNYLVGATNIVGAVTLGTAGSTAGSLGFLNATSGSITLSPPTGALGTVTLTLPGVSSTLGYIGLPQNSQSANYTTVAADSGKHILHPTSDNNARTFTIDSNANVAYPVGTKLTFINQINTLTIAITSDTMTLYPGGSTGSRTLAAQNVATAVKVGTTEWVISGSSGLT